MEPLVITVMLHGLSVGICIWVFLLFKMAFARLRDLRFWCIAFSFRPSVFWYPAMAFLVTQFLSELWYCYKSNFGFFFPLLFFSFPRQGCLASTLLVNKHNQIFLWYCIPMCVCWNCSLYEVGYSSSTWLQTNPAIFPFTLSFKKIQTWHVTLVKPFPEFSHWQYICCKMKCISLLQKRN